MVLCEFAMSQAQMQIDLAKVCWLTYSKLLLHFKFCCIGINTVLVCHVIFIKVRISSDSDDGFSRHDSMHIQVTCQCWVRYSLSSIRTAGVIVVHVFSRSMRVSSMLHCTLLELSNPCSKAARILNLASEMWEPSSSLLNLYALGGFVQSWQELIPNLDANITQYAHPSTKAGDASIPPANRVGPARWVQNAHVTQLSQLTLSFAFHFSFVQEGMGFQQDHGATVLRIWTCLL